MTKPLAPLSPPIFLRRNRLIAVCIAWLLFAVGSTVVCMTLIHDVGGTFWAFGTLLLPAILPFVWLLDYLLSRHGWLGRHPGIITAIDCGFAISLWFVPARSIGVLLLACTAYFIAKAISRIA